MEIIMSLLPQSLNNKYQYFVNVMVTKMYLRYIFFGQDENVLTSFLIIVRNHWHMWHHPEPKRTVRS